MNRKTKGPALTGMLVGALIAVLLLQGTPHASSPSQSSAVPFAKPNMPAYTNVSYTSTVDGWNLSYLEWLPVGFNASQPHSLGVFLHGIGKSTTWANGGVGGLQNLQAAPGIVTSAQADGVILISINTRSSAGFYQDTPCGGPQRQDVLDAIVHEQGERSISTVFLIGFSMGSMGAFALAASDPGAFAGVATVGTITDAYEVLAENKATGSLSTAWRADECLAGSAPLTSPQLQPLLYNLSALRFDPQAFANIRVYVVGGGQDTRATDNFSVWPYAQVNSTFVNSTCTVTTVDAEPTNCTVTFQTLHAGAPTQYTFRDVYESLGTHTPVDLPAADTWKFLLGEEAGGFFHTTAPPTRLIAGF